MYARCCADPKQNDKQPDYRGKADQNIEIGAAWIKVGQDSKAEYVQCPVVLGGS
jgi:uncharacterized protein (DUF736 family)